MPFKAPEAPKCPKCDRSVYAAEEKMAGGYKFHKVCFKCGKNSETKVVNGRNLLWFITSQADPFIPFSKNKLWCLFLQTCATNCWIPRLWLSITRSCIAKLAMAGSTDPRGLGLAQGPGRSVWTVENNSAIQKESRKLRKICQNAHSSYRSTNTESISFCPNNRNKPAVDPNFVFYWCWSLRRHSHFNPTPVKSTTCYTILFEMHVETDGRQDIIDNFPWMSLDTIL